MQRRVANRKRIYLHIGTHKTGSTSLQHYLARRANALETLGYGVFSGSIIPENHIELYLASMREGRDSLGQVSLRVEPGAELLRQTRERVAAFIAGSNSPRLIFTSEGLSLLRFDDELETLREIIQAEHNDVTIVLVLRNAKDFLKAYRRQLLKEPGRVPSSDPGSSLYVEPDSWLADFDALQDVYSRHFGAQNIVTIDYDAEVRRSGDVIQSVLAAMDIPDALMPAPGAIRQNRTTLRHVLSRLLRRFR